MPFSIRRFFAALLLAASAVQGSAHAADGTFRFRGYAYELESNRYIYTEVHEQRIVNDQWVGGSISYFDPDGKPLGHKTLDFSADPFIPIYRMELPEQGYSEGITAVGSKVVMTKTVKGEGEKTESVSRKGQMTADSGFHSFLRSHFAELMSGKKVEFTFVAAGYLDTFKFRARRVGTVTWQGREAVHIVCEPDSLLRLIAPDLDVYYDPEGRNLLEYRGVSNVRNPGTGKVYMARIAYYPEPPADGPKTLPPLEPSP